MAYKVFLDANIILDFALKREEFASSKKMIELAVDGEIQGFVTPSIVHIVGYWVTKAYGNSNAKELLLALLADVTVIDIPHGVVLNALHSKINDIEDALQYYTALYYKLDYFISRDRNFQKQQIPILPIYTPELFLKELIKA